MSKLEQQLLVCDCEHSMQIDENALAKSLGSDEAPTLHTQLCRAQLSAFEAAVKDGKPMLVACTQEAPLFMEAAAEVLKDPKADPEIGFVNIRERAGWGEAGKAALPKMAALIAEASMVLKPTTTVTMHSKGSVLVLGNDQDALEAAERLANRMDVTLLVTGDGNGLIPSRLNTVPTFTGEVKSASGHLGAFHVEVTGYRPQQPSAKGGLSFEGIGQDGTTICDIILDLRGGASLFTAGHRLDGYFHPDTGNPALVERALFDISDLVGDFSKPRYVQYDGAICAHSRSKVVGCSRCLDVCPTGAITPKGDQVNIDPYVCGGCGSCASVCPTGAAGYAMPSGEDVLKRMRTMLTTYRQAGGKDPVLLVHDAEHGDALIDMMARVGRGLPAPVIPFALNAVTQLGLDLLLGGLTLGASRIEILLPPSQVEEADGLKQQITYVDAIAEGLGLESGRINIIDSPDPDAVESRLWDLKAAKPLAEASFMPAGRKRDLMIQALDHLHQAADQAPEVVPLPDGAPFGTVVVNTDGCTLCLSCVGACPTGALRDNPDRPQLSFVENACVQCGLCKATCPEKVIALQPRINFTEGAKRGVVIKEEEPFACISCGKEFGSKSSVDHMIEKLKGHSMFQGKALDRLKMCEDCRVTAQFSEDSPFAMGTPRGPRTTDDYLREREELRQQANADIAAREKADKKH